MNWKDLLEKHYRHSAEHAFNYEVALYIPTNEDDEGNFPDYARWIAIHDDGCYVQTGKHRCSMREGQRYDSLEEAVVVAVALMELGAKG